MVAGLFTSSPMWLGWAIYWVARSVAHAVWWWLRTATLNMEALAPAASIVYWLAVWWTFYLGAWGWRLARKSYGVREAVDFGEGTRQLGKFPRAVIQWQTRTRVKVAAYGLAAGFGLCALLLAAGILGAWSLAVLVIIGVRRLQRARRAAYWATP